MIRLRSFLTALAALAIYVVMHREFDAPILVGLAVAIVGGVLFHRVLERRSRRKQSDTTAESESSEGPGLQE